MESFKKGATVLLQIEVRNKDDTLVSPNVSMTVSVLQDGLHKVVDAQAMTEDSTGMYHYDYQTSASQTIGKYRADYLATNDSRISSGEEWFELK